MAILIALRGSCTPSPLLSLHSEVVVAILIALRGSGLWVEMPCHSSVWHVVGALYVTLLTPTTCMVTSLFCWTFLDGYTKRCNSWVVIQLLGAIYSWFLHCLLQILLHFNQFSSGCTCCAVQGGLYLGCTGH